MCLLTAFGSPSGHESTSGHSARIELLPRRNLSRQAYRGLPPKRWLRNFQNDRRLRPLKTINRSVSDIGHLGEVRHARGTEGQLCIIGRFWFLALGAGARIRSNRDSFRDRMYPQALGASLCPDYGFDKSGNYFKARIPFRLHVCLFFSVSWCFVFFFSPLPG